MFSYRICTTVQLNYTSSYHYTFAVFQNMLAENAKKSREKLLVALQAVVSVQLRIFKLKPSITLRVHWRLFKPGVLNLFSPVYHLPAS